jgi:selenocysteine lyase/cysteine desulfurase
VAGEPPPKAAESLGVRRDEFDVPADVAYFNTASLSPLTYRVREAGERALERRTRPWTIADDDWFADVERLRTLFATLIGVGDDAEGVALVPATSYGLAVAARRLEPEPWQRIVVLAEEYPSGIYTWRALARRTGAEIVTVERPSPGSGDEGGAGWTEAILATLDERVAIVSTPNVHWTDGSLVDLDAVAARARELGARLIVDASQSAGAMPLDVAALRPDYLVSAGYKWLLGPFGVSYLYVALEHREGEPLEENWINRAGSEEFARLVDYRDQYQPGARRFDVGGRTNFHLVPMAIAALEQLLEWEVPRIGATLAETTAAIATGVSALGYGAPAPGTRGPHMLGAELGEEMIERAPAALAEAGVYAAPRSRALRISPHLHNTPAEVGRLLDALASLRA